MNDIVEKLRNGSPDIKKLWRLAWEAAAEIERLAAENERLTKEADRAERLIAKHGPKP